LNATAYFNEISINLNELARKTLANFASELKKMEIFDEATITKGTSVLDKRVTQAINKNLDIMENYAKENLFDIEDLRGQIELKNKSRSKSADKKDNRGQADAKSELENEFQEYRKQRNMQMLEKLSVEAKDKFQQSINVFDNQYKTADFEATTARNDVRIKNLTLFLNERKDMSDMIDSLIKN